MLVSTSAPDDEATLTVSLDGDASPVDLPVSTPTSATARNSSCVGTCGCSYIDPLTRANLGESLLLAACHAAVLDTHAKPFANAEGAVPGARLWLDQDQADKTEAGMLDGVRGSRFFVLMLTRCYFARWFCQLEAREAMALKKPIILIREMDARQGACLPLSPLPTVQQCRSIRAAGSSLAQPLRGAQRSGGQWRGPSSHCAEPGSEQRCAEWQPDL